ncbi:hypothetical protein Acr_18g0007870 [Actinidia rufa]|uniref:Uncharacterized protein n=1 Tax=Actinidia rufa TaxID=165716 RepID=A0A7J0G765_9ERIC|nr:hypothetical protein Acr_18g0007870 [Actinidia rufa]
MSKKINLKKLAQMAKASKCASPATRSVLIVKGKIASDAKKKGTLLPLEDKKKATSSKAESMAVSKGETPIVAPWEVYFRCYFGAQRLYFGKLCVAEKLLEGVITLLNKENMGKLDIDRAILRLFHKIGQVVEIGAQEQQAVEELRKMKEDRDANMAMLEVEVAEIKKKEALAKKSAIELYKSLDDF